VRVEAELVDGVVAHQPLAEKSGNTGDALRELIERGIGRWCDAARTAAVIDLADDGGGLFGRRRLARIGE